MHNRCSIPWLGWYRLRGLCFLLLTLGVSAQGVLNTVPGSGLFSRSAEVTFGASIPSPALRFSFGFATDEVVRPGEIPDSFTITLQDSSQNQTLVLVTLDAGGTVWAPTTPGTTPVSQESLVRTPIPYSSLTPVLAHKTAFELEVTLPQSFVGQSATVYFDLFSNDNGVPSQAWFSELVVVPEPSTATLLALGGWLVWWIGRRSPRRKDEIRDSREPPRGRWLSLGWLLVLGLMAPMVTQAQDKTFRLNGQDLILTDVSADADVYFRTMRLNRALNVWNVEVTVSNKTVRPLIGPVVLLVDSFDGTSGPITPDGLDDSQPGKAFYDLNTGTVGGGLSPGKITVARTLTLGRSGSGSPSLLTKVYAGRTPPVAALGVTRSLDEVGRPLPGVSLSVTGPAGASQQVSDLASGVASFGQGAGEHRLRFSADGFLPVWRQQSLSADYTVVLPNPRLTRRSDHPIAVTPAGGNLIGGAGGSIQIQIPAGAVTSAADFFLTPVTGQNLPAFLPLGWSPLSAFWIESSQPIQTTLPAALRPAGPIAPTETAALVRWNEAALQWIVTSTLAGNGSNAVSVELVGPGAYALVVADAGDLAPPSPAAGQALAPSVVQLPALTGLAASGTVTPPVSPASVVPEQVTGTAKVLLRHATSRLPSGWLLRGEVTETYLLNDGSIRLTPQYEHFIVGYRRPGDVDPQTLTAEFPMRPVLLFGPDQLKEATVRVDVLPEQPFDGQVLDAVGGQIVRDGVRLIAGAGSLTAPSALRMRRLDATAFTNLVGAGHTLVATFDLTVDGSTVGTQLSAQLGGAPANARFVLARVLSETGYYGLQPVERLQSDAQGTLGSTEPATGPRLPGLRGSGQFMLVQVVEPQGLIDGIARNGAGVVRAGMPVTLAGLPWLALTDAQGRYQLVAPAGSRELSVRDPSTGDVGRVAITVSDPGTGLNQDLGTAPRGPRVARITPAANATRVPRVGSVVIEFDEAVNPATVVNAIQILKPDDSAVVAAMTLNLANRIAMLSPATELEANTAYRVRLASTITDPGGLPLEGQGEFTFTTVPLSTRDPAAQLIIYQPGATNVPVAILDEIPAYEAGRDPSAIVVHGTPGVADPEVAVILVNESTGETATVLSKPDGSFSSVISGSEADFVSATFVNLNDTRVYVPVSRQQFDNGFVGLYRQGGILEAESDGGPVQVYIQPEAVPTRTKFRMKTITAAQLKAELGGVEPELAKVAGSAMHIEVEGPPPEKPLQASFPVDLAELGYPRNQSPDDAVLALTVVRDTDGVKSFEVLDQMVFKPNSPVGRGSVQVQNAGDFAGLVLSVSGFVPGAVGLVPLVYDWIIVPTLMLGAKPVVVAGQTYYYQVGDPKQGQNAISRQMLSGTFVVLRQLNGPEIGTAGRVQPGWVYASSGADGRYKMIAPFAGQDYRLTATHPLFQDSDSAVVANLLHTGGATRDFVFKNPLALQLTPRVVIANAPQYPVAGQACEVQVSATQAVGGPPHVDVEVLNVSTTNLLTGLVETNTTAALTGTNAVGSGNNTLWTGMLTANKPVKVTLKVQVQGKVALKPIEFPIAFAGPPPPPTNSFIPPPDTNEVHGPLVISTQPPESGFVDASGAIKIFFDKPIDTYVKEHVDGVILADSPTAASPVVQLGPDQTVLTLRYAGLEPNQSYRLTLTGASIRDLGGKPLDQRPSTTADDSFTMTFRTPPVVTADIPGLANGRGAVIRGDRLYVLDQAQPENSLVAYDISNPGKPKFLSRTRLLGAPRDLVIIPQYSYVLGTHSPVVTNDLVVAVGGDLDTVTLETKQAPFVRGHGQYLTVVNMANPGSPEVLASPVVSLRPGSAVTKVRWAAPFLVYEEFGADIQQLVFVHLQELLIGFGTPAALRDAFPPGGKAGVDSNGDGDYVDPGEILPLPATAAEFFGKGHSLVLQHTTQKILDFSVSSGGNLVGVTLKAGVQLDNGGRPTGQSLPPAYRTLAFNNQVLDLSNPTNGTLPFAANVYPRWVTILNSLPVVSNGVPQLLPALALVSLTPDSDGMQRLAVIDISLPLQPRVISKIPIPDELLGGLMQTVTLRPDRRLAVAGPQNVVLLDPSFLLATEIPAGQLHPAIVGSIPVAGGSTRSLGSTDYGVYAVADGGRGKVVLTPPTMTFVSFPGGDAVVDPAGLRAQDDVSLDAILANLRLASAIPPATLSTNFAIRSDLNPPNPALHFHVMVTAPGSSGITMELGLESVNLAGRPLGNPGQGFAPVRAVSGGTQLKIGQMPRPNCGASIRSLTAYRMSDNPKSPYYNRYLSRPFALIYQRVTSEQLTVLKGQLDREILFSASALRAFIDPSEQLLNPVVGKFAAQIDEAKKLIYPVASVTAFTLNQSYIMGDNPPPPGGSVKLPGTHGTVSAHSGELRMEATDMVLPGPRMPIEIKREIGDQDTYEGPFGVGWDFNYNQRLTELMPQLFPAGLQMPLVVRGSKADSELAGSQDVLFHTGLGRTVLFKWVDTNMPPGFTEDPLVKEFNYRKEASDYYLPEKRQGVFDLLVKRWDGRFERLTPEGTRYRYAPDGRLMLIIDGHPKNRHVLEYDNNGWLIRINDRSVSSSRYVQFGYFRRLADSGFNSDVDVQTDNGFLEGKICRLRDYAGGEVLFNYNAEGFLTNRQDKLVGGENGGFSGRAQTFYLYNGCQLVGVSATANGTPIFSATSASNSDGKPVVQSGASAGGNVQVSVPMDNSAAKSEGQTSSATLDDGSTTQFKFDKLGHPTSATALGGGAGQASTIMSNNDDGLVIFVKYPEGNSKTMIYDSGNAVFRSRGNLRSVTVDPGPRGGVGYTEAYQFDPRYNLRSGDQIDGNAFVTKYQLSPDGRWVRSIVHGEAGTETFGYNESGQPTSAADLEGVTTTISYDPATGFVNTRRVGESAYAYTYGGDYASQLGRASSITMPEGAPVLLRYNANLKPVERRRGSLVETYAYDEQSQVIFHQQELGDGKKLTTRSAFNEKGFLKTNTIVAVEVNGQSASLETVFTPDNQSRIQKIRHPQGSIETFAYDSRGNVTHKTLGSYAEQYTLDLNNNITEITQGGAVVKTIVYDGLDRPIKIASKTGTQEIIQTLTYHPLGQLKSSVLADGQFGTVREQTYDPIDAMGRPLKLAVTGTRNSPSYQYDYAPGSKTVTGPRQSLTRTWNSAGFETGSSAPNLTEVLHPDRGGRVERVERREDGATYSELFTYNDLDQRVSAADDLGPLFQFGTRTDGKLRGVTNALGHATLFEHSELGELLSRRRGDGMEFRYQHDSQRATSYVGDAAAGFHYAYDEDRRLTNSTLRDGAATRYGAFDPRGMPQSLIIPGGTMTLRHDLQRRLTDKAVTFQSTGYEFHQVYDAANRARVVTYKQDGGAQNTATLVYDKAGPLLSARYEEEGAAFTVEYEHYEDQTRKSVKYPSGVLVTEQRDARGRLTGVSDEKGVLLRALSWQGNAQPRTLDLGPSINIANRYDARGRLVATRATRAANAAVLIHMRYQYDAANNLLIRQFLHRAGLADNFSYDLGERLSRAQVGTLPTTAPGFTPPLYERGYGFDPGGLDYLTSVSTAQLGLSPPAFASEWTAHDAFLQPTVVNGFTRGPADPVGHVQNAELQVRPEGGGAASVAASLSHNGNGNLIRIVRADGVAVENSYEPDGTRFARRITKDGLTLEVRHYVYDDRGRLLEEYDRSGPVPRLIGRYYYSNSDAPEAADLREAASGILRRYYYLKDQAQSVIAVGDINGNVVERVWYDPYGQPVIELPDTAAPAVQRVMGGDAGSLLIVFSEAVRKPLADPGAGSGIERFDPEYEGALTVSSGSGPVEGAWELVPALTGFGPYSVFRFSPAEALSGSFTLTLNAGTVADEWGNTNGARTIPLQVTGEAGKIYYSAQPALDTGARVALRSSVGSPFLFHGQYFDYDTGLIYLRARFYDPYSGMFLEPDPLGYEDSVNLYAGMRNNPVGVRDPTGLAGEKFVGELVELIATESNAAKAESAAVSEVIAGANSTENLVNAANQLSSVSRAADQVIHGSGAINAQKEIFLGINIKLADLTQEAEVLKLGEYTIEAGTALRTAELAAAGRAGVSVEHFMADGQGYLRKVKLAAQEVAKGAEAEVLINVNVQGFAGKDVYEKVASAILRGFKGYATEANYAKIEDRAISAAMKAHGKSVLDSASPIPLSFDRGFQLSQAAGTLEIQTNMGRTARVAVQYSRTDIEMYILYKEGALKHVRFVEGLVGETPLQNPFTALIK